MATLTYGSVNAWMELALWAQKELETGGYDLDNPTDIQAYLLNLTQHASETGFSMLVGDRRYGLSHLLRLLDERIYHSIATSETWMYGLKPKSTKVVWYYVRVKRTDEDDWHYMRVGDRLGKGRYSGRDAYLDYNGHYEKGYGDTGALYKSQQRSAASNLRERILYGDRFDIAQVTTKAPEGE